MVKPLRVVGPVPMDLPNSMLTSEVVESGMQVVTGLPELWMK